MPTPIIADPISTGQVVPSGMAINPVFDWSPFLGLPIWLFISVGFLLLFIYVNIYWMLRIGKLSSVKGWRESLKKMGQEDQQVWVISRMQKLTIECMTSKDNVLSSHDPVNIAMYHVNSPMGIIRIGGNPAVVISEDFDQNRDVVTEIALCHVIDEFNANQEELKDDVTQATNDAKAEGRNLPAAPVVKPMEDCGAYEVYGRKVLEQLYPEGLDIPPYNIFNPNRFRKYFPKGCSGMWFGGELIHDARKLNLRRKEKGFWEVYTFLLLAGGIALVAIIAAWLFPLPAG